MPETYVSISTGILAQYTTCVQDSSSRQQSHMDPWQWQIKTPTVADIGNYGRQRDRRLGGKCC